MIGPQPPNPSPCDAYELDHLAAAGDALFVAVKENNTVAVVNITTGAYVGTFSGLQYGPQEVTAVPSLGANGVVFVSGAWGYVDST